jgi:carboxyl-terminal processing protease
VYGGGGISPDFKVTLDTTFNSQFLMNVAANGLLNKLAYEYIDQNRQNLKLYKNIDEFIGKFEVQGNLMNKLVEMAVKEQIKKPSEKELQKSATFIKNQLKALIARQLWRDNGYFKVTSLTDKTIKKALEELKR